MTGMLILRGPPAMSAFRLEKLRTQLPGPDRRIYAEYVHLLLLTRMLDSGEHSQAHALLKYGPRTGHPEAGGERVATVVPGLGTVSPWSSKATNIFHICGLANVIRVERGIRWYMDTPSDGSVIDGLYDRMTQCVISEDNLNAVFAESRPRPLTRVPVFESGVAALEQANEQLGLASSRDEVDYLADAYSGLGRDPTDVELMMFAQANSEHCRHKIFNASWTLDGETQELSLFQMIKNTYAMHHDGILSAYHDNSAVIRGFAAHKFAPSPDSAEYAYEATRLDILMKVETHNHPTAISPFAGAATGS